MKSKHECNANVSNVKNDIMQYGCEVDSKEIIDALLQGQTIVPSYVHGAISSQYTFISQQLWMIDVDNHDASVTVNTVIEAVRSLGLEPWFIYETFSSTPEVGRWRVCLLSNEEVTDETVRAIIMDKLLGAVGSILEVDTHCKDTCRLFYGGSKQAYYNEDARVTIGTLLRLTAPKQPVRSQNNVSVTTNTLDASSDNEHIALVRNRDAKGLGNLILSTFEGNEGFAEPYNITTILFGKTSTGFNAYSYKDLEALDMPLLLGMPENTTFRCFIHDDHNPSANIFRNKDGHYRYRCHGCMEEGQALSTVGVVERLLGSGSKYEAVKFIRDLLGIEESDWLKDRKAELRDYKDYIGDDSESPLGNEHPALYKELSKAKVLDHLKAYMDIAQQYLLDRNEPADERTIIYMSNAIAASGIRNIIAKGNSESAVYKKLTFLCRLGLIKKLSKDEIPSEMYRKAIALQVKTKARYHTSFYCIPRHSDRLFMEAERILQEEYKDKNIRRSNYCREQEIMANGKAVADAIFPQSSNQGVSSKTKRFYAAYKTRATVQLMEEGYTSEKQILKSMRGYSAKQKRQLSYTCLPKLLQDLNLQRVRLNKELAQKYNILGLSYGTIILISTENPS